MQPVNILGHHRDNFPLLLQGNTRFVNGIRFSITECDIRFEFLFPVLGPGGVRPLEILEVYRLSPLPHTLWSAKVRYAAWRRNTRPGKNQDP